MNTKKHNAVTITNPAIISRLHFAAPTLCCFRREDEDDINVGIALDTAVICLCCGGINPLDEIDYLKYSADDEWPDIARTSYFVLGNAIGTPFDDEGV